MTQTERVVEYIRTHPGCTTMEITLALSPFVSNPRARISDARAHGFVISKVKDERGVWRFRVVSARPAPLTGQQTSLPL